MQNDFDHSKRLTCPYDPSHLILESKMQVHLGRCRRNHKDVPKVTCPFNVTHVLNKPELNWHVLVCSDRAGFENYKYRDEPTTRATKVPPPVLREIETAENWDDEPDVPTYNPQIYTSQAPVLRCMKGRTPSEKKQFRASEHIRLRSFD